MTAYYNENDPFAAAWLRELIKAGLIAKGEVDERSIEDVRPSDLVGFKQCHFFAGIGVWSYALRSAGWPDDRAVWTGSCPCQPFSAAGKRKGTSDERHLWPSFYHLIEQSSPRTVFGEQVASKDGLAWLDTVQTDLEAQEYSFAAIDFCAAGVGAPHLRQRLYFVADSSEPRRTETRQYDGGPSSFFARPSERSGNGILANSNGRQSGNGDVQRSGQHGQRQEDGSAAVELGDSDESRPQGFIVGRDSTDQRTVGKDGVADELADSESQHDRGGKPRTSGRSESSDRSYVNGFWRDAVWLYCRDEKYRPTKPGIFPLVDGTSRNRVGKLRGSGNALCAPQATAFIEAFLET